MSIAYARVDAVVGSDITLTVIEGTSTGSGAIVLADVIRPLTATLPASSRALIKPTLVGKVVRLEGFPSLYVRKWWVGKQYMKESTYELYATSLTEYRSSKCLKSTRVGVKMRFAVDPSLRLTTCNANGVTWVYTDGRVEYDVISVRSVTGAWFVKTTPLRAQRWTRTDARWSPGSLEVMYDVHNDGKPALAALLTF